MLYAVGGRHDSGYRLKTVECFNVQTQEWEYCPEMREARGALRCAQEVSLEFARLSLVFPSFFWRGELGRRATIICLFFDGVCAP